MDHADPYTVVSCDAEDPCPDEWASLARSRYLYVSRFIDSCVSRSRRGVGCSRCDHEPPSGACLLCGEATGASCRSGACDGFLSLQQCGDRRALCAEEAWPQACVDCGLGCASWERHAA